MCYVYKPLLCDTGCRLVIKTPKALKYSFYNLLFTFFVSQPIPIVPLSWSDPILTYFVVIFPFFLLVDCLFFNIV
jgi:hypothetical protein